MELAHYATAMEGDEGSAASYIPLARNEQPGYYNLHVRDVITGIEATTRVEILSVMPESRVKTNFN
ncbi:hypothetical protein D3C83_189690 [compost metagenome]